MAGGGVDELDAAELTLLTPNAALQEVNLAWHPRAEELLWRPDIQEEKRSESGAVNYGYGTPTS